VDDDTAFVIHVCVSVQRRNAKKKEGMRWQRKAKRIPLGEEGPLVGSPSSKSIRVELMVTILLQNAKYG
jgi:hypothetical protein